MNKKIIIALLAFAVLLSALAYSQISGGSSSLLALLAEEEGAYYNQDICIDPETGEIKILAEEYAKPLEAMQLESVFPVDTRYLRELSDVVEQRKVLVDNLLGSSGLQQYRDLAAGNPLGDFVKVKVLPLMEGAGDLVRVSTELYRDASGQALSMTTAPLFTSYDVTQSAKNGAMMNILFQGMMSQLESNGELEKAVDYAAGIITQQTQAQSVITDVHSFMNLAKEGAKTATNMFALAESVGVHNPQLGQRVMTIGMFQMAQALAYTQESAKLKMLVLFMLLNDIRVNKMRYQALMTALGPPCDLDPYLPCLGCPYGFYLFTPKGCPKTTIGPLPPGGVRGGGSGAGAGAGAGGAGAGGGGAGGGSGAAILSGMAAAAAAKDCNGNLITGAGVSAQQQESAEVLPAQVFTEFPSFSFKFEEPKLEYSLPEPSTQSIVKSYQRKLELVKKAFISKNLKGITETNGKLYAGNRLVALDSKGNLIDSKTGVIVEKLGFGIGSTYSALNFAEKRLKQVAAVAELEAQPILSNLAQDKYMLEYRNMIRADLRFLDLIYNQEVSKIDAMGLSEAQRNAKLAELGFMQRSKKIEQIEASISDARLAVFMEKVSQRAEEIKKLMAERTTENNAQLIIQVTDDEELARYYMELKQG